MLGRLLNRGFSSLDISSSSPAKEDRTKHERKGGLSPKSTFFALPKLKSPSPTPTAATVLSDLSPDTPAIVNNEDSYSRTILYGTPNHFQSDSLLPQNFRMVVVLEKSDLLQKNNYSLLYDSSKEVYPNYQHYHSQYPSRSRSRSNSNNINNNHMSIPPPPTQQPSATGNQDIRHPLSQLNEFMFGNGLYSNDLNLSDTVKLHVLPSLPLLKSSVLITKCFYVKIEKRESRVSIGLVMPISIDRFSTMLFPNWETIKFFLSYMRDAFTDNHYNKQVGCVVNAGNFNDMSRVFKGLIKSLNNLNNIPRLLPGLNTFDSMLYNWCFEVNNWIEMKDGGKLSFNNGSKFLSALLTAISVVKNQLVYNDEADKSESTRVIVVASNPGVAQKLIFLISELLPFELDYVFQPEDSQQHYPSSVTTRSTSANSVSTAQPIDGQYNEQEQEQHSIPNINYDNNSASTLTISGEELKDTVPLSTPSFTKKGWEIPGSSAKSINTTSIEIVHSSSIKSSPTSNSMAYLSSSLSNSHSSMIPSSLTRGFQLLQNWKATVDSPSSSVSSTTFSNQSFPSLYNQEFYDDYPWTPATTIGHPTPTVTSINPNSLNTTHFNERHVRSTSIQGHSHRPSFPSISRNNSYFDLNTANPTKIKKVNIPKLPQISRNSSTLYGIGEGSVETGVNLTRSYRYSMLKAECKNLMNSNTMFISSVEIDDNGTTYMDVVLDDDEEGNDYDESLKNTDTVITTTRTVHSSFTTLPLTCSYINEYAPEFQLQACPPQADLENKILNSMKLDVTHGGFKSCKSIVISLRSREIKQLGLEVSGTRIGSGSGGSVINVTNKKLYGNSKINWTLTPRENFNRVDSLIEEILGTFQKEQIAHKGVNLEDLDDDVRFKPFIRFRELLMNL